MGICVSNTPTIEVVFKQERRFIVVLAILLVTGSLSLTYSLRKCHLIALTWYKAEILSVNEKIELADIEFKRYYEELKHNSSFLLGYAQNLSCLNQYGAVEVVLNRLSLVSCDPIIYNRKGINYIRLKRYKDAEDCFKKSISMLPGRIYPYYLLTELYARPDYFHKEKMQQMANIVLTKKNKINSPAIEEMRSKVKKRLKD